jgi:hypothetical protein
MGRGHKPLLAELHAHTTWSDGVLTPGELVDLHGRAGFDVLAITDHVVRSEFACHVRAETYRDYLAAIDAEAERARKQYLFTWKTLLTCECTEGAVVERIRSSAPCALMRITAGRIAA